MDAAYRQKLKKITKQKRKHWKARKKARVAEERQKERRDRFIESLRQTGDLKVAYHTSRTEIPGQHIDFDLNKMLLWITAKSWIASKTLRKKNNRFCLFSFLLINVTI